ncbi:MAG: PhnD/SsuA/transferrin family substrate-binding protein [Pelovirga sp.]
MKLLNHLLLLLLLLVVCSLLLIQPVEVQASATTTGEEKNPLKVGVLAFRSVSQLLDNWQPLADHLSHSLDGRPVELVAADFSELEALVAGSELDFVLTNPSHYIELRSRNFLTSAIATLIVEGQQEAVTGFGGVVFTRSDRSDIATLKDITEQRIAVVSTSSLGGYRTQAMALREQGVRLPAKQDLLLTGMPHDNAVLAVLTGAAEVGFVRTGVIEAMIAEGRLEPAQIKVLGKRSLTGFPFVLSTRLYPEWPFIALASADAEVARRVAAALYLFTPDETTAWRMGVAGFDIPADYQAVEDLARTLRLPPYDSVPAFGIADVWQQYRWLIVAGMVALLIMTALVIVAMLINRQLFIAKNLLDIERSRLAGIIEGTDVGTWEWNVQTSEVIFNERWAEMIGYSLAELTPISIATWMKHTHPDDLKMSEEGLQQHFNGSLDYYECECRMRHKNGHWVWVLDRGKVMSWTNDGKPLMMMGTHLDITGRKQSEEALRRSEERNRALLQALPDLMLLISNDGLLLDVHTTDPDRLLMPPDEFINRRLCEVVPAEVAAEALQCIERARRHNSLEKHEYALEIRGREHYFESRIAVCGDSSCLAIIRDITERKSAEQALQKKNTEMEEFVYIVSHDLKSPLVTMKSFLAMLRDNLRNDNRELINEDISYIEGATDKMDQLLEALLEYSRVGNSDQPHTILSLAEVISSCVDTLAGRLKTRAIDIKTALVPLYLHGDQLRFGQIWQNLIENAVKYMGDQPRPSIEIGVEEREKDIVFYVRDNGVGIAADQQQLIFGMFSQLHKGNDGIGLGLALVKKIVESYQGQLWVESAGVGQGSCFCFTLPAAVRREEKQTVTS